MQEPRWADCLAMKKQMDRLKVQISQNLNRTEKSVVLSTELLKLGRRLVFWHHHHSRLLASTKSGITTVTWHHDSRLQALLQSPYGISYYAPGRRPFTAIGGERARPGGGHSIFFTNS